MNRVTRLMFAIPALLSACSDSLRLEPGRLQNVVLDFCPSLMPTWVAIQSEGEAWKQVTPQALLVVEVTERFSLAVVQNFGDNTFTHVLNATVSEMGGNPGIPCESPSGNAAISGSVAGLTGTQFARISAGGATAGASVDAPTFQLSALASNARDVVATRYPSIFSTPANRIIIRRGVLPIGTAPIPSLDFDNSFESFALESATATFANMGTGNLAVDVDLYTATGTAHNLMAMGPSTATAVNYVSVPAQLRMSTDIHELYAVATSAQATRTISHYYRVPAAKTLVFGPVVNDATVSTVATSPYVRTRAQIASQAEYPTAVMIQLDNANAAEPFKSVSVVTTSGFAGGRPATWDLTVPDMTSGGYEAAWGLQTAPDTYVVYGFNGSAGALLGATPTDGATITTGLRFGPSLFNARAKVPRPTGLVRVR